MSCRAFYSCLVQLNSALSKRNVEVSHTTRPLTPLFGCTWSLLNHNLVFVPMVFHVFSLIVSPKALLVMYEGNGILSLEKHLLGERRLSQIPWDQLIPSARAIIGIVELFVLTFLAFAVYILLSYWFSFPRSTVWWDRWRSSRTKRERVTTQLSRIENALISVLGRYRTSVPWEAKGHWLRWLHQV